MYACGLTTLVITGGATFGFMRAGDAYWEACSCLHQDVEVIPGQCVIRMAACLETQDHDTLENHEYYWNSAAWDITVS